MKKIYTKGNYLVIELPTGVKQIKPCKDIKISRINESDKFHYRTEDEEFNQTLDWRDFQDESGTAFSSLESFEEFIYSNTGNFSKGEGNSPTPDTAFMDSEASQFQAGDKATLDRLSSYQEEMDPKVKAAASRTFVQESSTQMLRSAEGYSDSKCGQTYSKAKTYADLGDVEMLENAKSYADNQDSKTLSSAEDYADGLFATMTGGALPESLDTLIEMTQRLQEDQQALNALITALGYRLRFDISDQGLSAQQKQNAKINLGLENVSNTADADKPVSSATSEALGQKANRSLKINGNDLTADFTIPTVNTVTSSDLSVTGSPATTAGASIGLNLKKSGVTAGGYGQVTVNDKGIVTGGKRSETYSGVTSAAGVFSVTFANAFATVPVVYPTTVTNLNNLILKVTSVNTTGFTVASVLRVDALGVLPTFSIGAGIAVTVRVDEK